MDFILYALVLPFFSPILGPLESFDITLTTLDPKVTPFAIVEDADAKDMKLRKRSRFKPTGQGEPELKKRFTFQSKRDGASATLCHAKAISGDVMAWSRVAVDKLDGLVTPSLEEGVPPIVAYILMGCVLQGLVEGEPQELEASAAWNEATAGLRAQAMLGGKPVGVPVDFPGAKEIFLVVERAGGLDSVYAAAAVSDEPNGYGALQLLHQVALPEGPPPFISVDLGVENLGKKGRVYVAQTTFHVTPGTVLGTNPTETSFGETLYDAFLGVDFVDTALFFPFQGFGALLTPLQASRTSLDAALAQLQETRGGFDAETPVDKIEKQLVRASKALDQAIAKAEKLQSQKASSHKPLKGVVNRAQKGLRIASALLMGFQTQSLGKLDKTVNY